MAFIGVIERNPYPGLSEEEALAYVASWPDLMDAFGPDPVKGLGHYIHYRAVENRPITFNAVWYLNYYADLKEAFGDNLYNATWHYIMFGRFEGRYPNPESVPGGGGDIPPENDCSGDTGSPIDPPVENCEDNNCSSDCGGE